MDTAGKTFYEILGVEREATRDEIRRAYREIAQVYHPDSQFFSEIIEDRISNEQLITFKAVTAAYHTLMNEDLRRRYDETLPPRLRDWEEESNLKMPRSSFDQILSEPGKPGAAPAFGTFGVTGGEPRARPKEQEHGAVRSMSEIIELRQPLFRRILRFFGL